MSFASLSPTLLARKGGAKPAMRRQSPMIAGALEAPQAPEAGPDESVYEDLGWNDLGEPQDATPVDNTDDADSADDAGDTPGDDTTGEETFAPLTRHAHSSAHAPANALVEAGNDDTAQDEETLPSAENVTPIHTRAPRLPRPKLVASQPASASTDSGQTKGKRTAFTLRLDADRHLKLRLACTLAGRSAQSLVTEAVDALFAATPELDTLVARVQSRTHQEG